MAFKRSSVRSRSAPPNNLEVSSGFFCVTKRLDYDSVCGLLFLTLRIMDKLIIQQTETILFFDGICVMCNRLIQFVLRHDKRKQVKFATIQGGTAERYLPEPIRMNLKTVVLVDHRGMHTEADAIIRLLIAMGGSMQMARALYVFPRFMRNSVYGYIANNRYRWFGTTESCALLTPEQKTRILD